MAEERKRGPARPCAYRDRRTESSWILSEEIVHPGAVAIGGDEGSLPSSESSVRDEGSTSGSVVSMIGEGQAGEENVEEGTSSVIVTAELFDDEERQREIEASNSEAVREFVRHQVLVKAEPVSNCWKRNRAAVAVVAFLVAVAAVVVASTVRRSNNSNGDDKVGDLEEQTTSLSQTSAPTEPLEYCQQEGDYYQNCLEQQLNSTFEDSFCSNCALDLVANTAATDCFLFTTEYCQTISSCSCGPCEDSLHAWLDCILGNTACLGKCAVILE